jgi:hypothetical protein
MSETSTVVELVNQEEQFALLSHPNYKSKFRIYRPKGRYHFFKVELDQGATPNELSGSYSSLEIAIKATINYLNNSKETFSVRSDRLAEERKARNAAKLQPANS